MDAIRAPIKRPTVVRLSPDMYDWLRDYAHSKRLTQSSVVQDALIEYLSRKDEEDA